MRIVLTDFSMFVVIAVGFTTNILGLLRPVSFELSNVNFFVIRQNVPSFNQFHAPFHSYFFVGTIAETIIAIDTVMSANDFQPKFVWYIEIVNVTPTIITAGTIFNQRICLQKMPIKPIKNVPKIHV